MTSTAASSDDLLRRAGAGDPLALAELFARYRGRLRRMVRLRLDRRLQGRVDPSDVLQEALNGMDMARLWHAADLGGGLPGRECPPPAAPAGRIEGTPRVSPSPTRHERGGINR